MFNLDQGQTGGGEGPFLAWSARGTMDGSVPARTFFVRDANGKTPVDISAGFVMDLTTIKTGWQKSDGIVGVAPEWKWNAAISNMMPSPGEDWKKGFSVRCAIGDGQTAVWEQSGTGAWQALVNLTADLSKQPSADKCPVVAMSGVEELKFSKGDTSVPTLSVVSWVDRPLSLSAETPIAAFDAGVNAAPPATAKPKAEAPLF